MLPKSKTLRNQGVYRNSKCSSDRHKPVCRQGRDIHLTEGGLGVGNDTEKSADLSAVAEVIVINRMS